MKTRYAPGVGTLFAVGLLVAVSLLSGCGRSSSTATVVFSDLNLENTIRRQFTRHFDGDIPRTELERIKYLDLGVKDIATLDGIEHCVNLTELHLNNNKITDLTLLASLTNLTVLDLSSNQISDLTPLAGMTHLTVLYLGGNQIVDIRPLAGMTNLTNLRLGWNQIIDLTPLAGVTYLKMLDLRHNWIEDISALEGLTSISGLYLDSNRLDIEFRRVSVAVDRYALPREEYVPLTPAAQIIKLFQEDRGANVTY